MKLSKFNDAYKDFFEEAVLKNLTWKQGDDPELLYIDDTSDFLSPKQIEIVKKWRAGDPVITNNWELTWDSPRKTIALKKRKFEDPGQGEFNLQEIADAGGDSTATPAPSGSSPYKLKPQQPPGRYVPEPDSDPAATTPPAKPSYKLKPQQPPEIGRAHV